MKFCLIKYLTAVLRIKSSVHLSGEVSTMTSLQYPNENVPVFQRFHLNSNDRFIQLGQLSYLEHLQASPQVQPSPQSQVPAFLAGQHDPVFSPHEEQLQSSPQAHSAPYLQQAVSGMIN